MKRTYFVILRTAIAGLVIVTSACSKPDEAARSGSAQDMHGEDVGGRDGSAGLPGLGPRQNNPLGFSVEAPQGWTIDAPTLETIAVLSPDGVSAPFIRVRMIDGDPAQWLGGEFLRGEAWATHWRTLSLSSLQQGVVRASFDVQRADGLPLRVSALAISSGRIVTVMLAAAPAQQFGAVLPVLAATLESFRFGQTSAAPAQQAPALQFVMWREPREGAFTLEVPAGWNVEGGVVRPDATGTRSQVVMTAPGNRHVVFYGDWNLPRQFTQAGATVRGLGDAAVQGQGQGYVLANYQDAPAFASGYLQQRFGAVQITNVTPLPMVEQRYAQLSSFIGRPQEHHSAALVEFRIADGRQGAMSVVTSVMANGFDDGALWTVQDLGGFLSAPEELWVGALAFAHGRKTTHLDPRWFAGELGASQAAATQMQQSRDEISGIQAGNRRAAMGNRQPTCRPARQSSFWHHHSGRSANRRAFPDSGDKPLLLPRYRRRSAGWHSRAPRKRNRLQPRTGRFPEIAGDSG